MPSVTLYPSAYVSYSGTSISGQTNVIGKGSTNTSSSYVARLGTRRTTSYAIWSFDTSAIPAGATITSVTCTARVRQSTSSNITTKVQMYAGTTAKGSASSTTSTSSTVLTLSVGSWTLSELANARIRITSTGTKSQTYYTYFYGATLTIQYEEAVTEDSGLRIKVNGSYVVVKKIYRKTNGAYVEIQASDLDQTAKYRLIE